MSTEVVDIEDVVHAPADGAVQGYFKVKETSGNLLRIVGWAFSDNPEPPTIEVRAEEDVVGFADPRIPRPDVAELFPGVEVAGRSGFEIALEAHGVGRSELEVEAVLPNGSRHFLGRIAVVIE
jgi:hypothetical protein